jgi:IS30 family transposase
MKYHELCIEERATIQVGRVHGISQRAIALTLGRSPATISRELRRNTNPGGTYHVAVALTLSHMCQRRVACRPRKKRLPGTELFELVVDLLRRFFSPELIAGKLHSMNIPSFEDAYICRETI